MKTSRSTIAKTAIAKLIERSDLALSHREIQDQVGALCNRVTIYRVLDRLVEDGEVHKIVDMNGVIKYAACNNCVSEYHSHNHVHFSCERCQSVICLDEVKPRFELPKNYVVKETNFTISGLCPDCVRN